MPADVRIEFDDQVSAGLDRLAASGRDLTPVMADIAAHLADEARERFETSTGPDGMPWKPSQRAIGYDGNKGGFGPHHVGGKTLVDTGDLLASIREDWGADYAAAGPEASGGAAVYAAIHQFGGTIRPKAGREGKDGHAPALSLFGRFVASVTIPARPYLGFTDADGAYVVGAIGDFLVDAAGGGAAGSAA